MTMAHKFGIFTDNELLDYNGRNRMGLFTFRTRMFRSPGKRYARESDALKVAAQIEAATGKRASVIQTEF